MSLERVVDEPAGSLGRAPASTKIVKLSWRADIQVLRAVAVILVILDHAGFTLFPGGFLGVDIFFVISGFLMTTMIVSRLDAGTFSFRDFYERRARRLLPAAYATILVTMALSPFLLDPLELHDFFWQAVGSFSFTVNVVLWRQIDYFAYESDLKPLLHMWSLSLEEQFYLLLPAALFLCPRRFRLAGFALLIVLSGAACAYVLSLNPSGAFYLLPFRAWEFALGGVAAVLIQRGFVLPGRKIVIYVAGAALLALPILSTNVGHPGLAAWLICLATCAVLMSARESTEAGPLQPLVAVGDRSYSLYLTHWPVFAFANNLYIEHMPGYMAYVLLAICLLWAELQYRFVENPLRGLKVTRPVLLSSVALPALALLAMVPLVRSTEPVVEDRRGTRSGLSPACAPNASYEPRPVCDSRPNPTTLVWGDSTAMRLADALATALPEGVRQATRYVCGPIQGLSATNPQPYDLNWARGCLKFNDDVMAHLEQMPSIKTIVMSSAWMQYIPGAEKRGWKMLVRDQDGTVSEKPQDLTLLLDGIRRTVEKLRAQGRRVVVISPPPIIVSHTGRCLNRADFGVPSISDMPDCSIPLAQFQRERGALMAMLDRLAAEGIVDVIRLDKYLCHDDVCDTRIDKMPIYAERSYLTRNGARRLAKDMGWAR